MALYKPTTLNSNVILSHDIKKQKLEQYILQDNIHNNLFIQQLVFDVYISDVEYIYSIFKKLIDNNIYQLYNMNNEDNLTIQMFIDYFSKVNDIQINIIKLFFCLFNDNNITNKFDIPNYINNIILKNILTEKIYEMLLNDIVNIDMVMLHNFIDNLIHITGDNISFINFINKVVEHDYINDLIIKNKNIVSILKKINKLVPCYNIINKINKEQTTHNASYYYIILQQCKNVFECSYDKAMLYTTLTKNKNIIDSQALTNKLHKLNILVKHENKHQCVNDDNSICIHLQDSKYINVDCCKINFKLCTVTIATDKIWYMQNCKQYDLHHPLDSATSMLASLHPYLECYVEGYKKIYQIDNAGILILNSEYSNVEVVFDDKYTVTSSLIIMSILLTINDQINIQRDEQINNKNILIGLYETYIYKLLNDNIIKDDGNKFSLNITSDIQI